MPRRQWGSLLLDGWRTLVLDGDGLLLEVLDIGCRLTLHLLCFPGVDLLLVRWLHHEPA